MKWIDYHGNGYKYHEPVFSLSDNIYPENLKLHRGAGHNRDIQYLDTFITFDIETTSINEGDYHEGFMYLWQLCIGNQNCKIVYMGRTWEEFIVLLAKIKVIYNLSASKKMVIYVHYLPFEYQFIKDFIKIKKLFAKDVRKPLKLTCDTYEFRCSQALSNMSLKEFIKYTHNTVFYKLDGDEYDYKKIRTPQTSLSDMELGYGYNDVRGLHDSICKLLEEDNLATIPLTSTGYVRRDVRNALKINQRNRERFLNKRLSVDDYEICKQAFRGGDTHASRFASDVIISGIIYCVDLTSAYPWAMLTQYYPAHSFIKTEIKTDKELKYFVENKCCLFYLELFDLHLKPDETSSYIPLAKTISRHKVLTDNGRIIKADYIKIAVTEIDYKIIKETYTAKHKVITGFRYANRAQLPEEERKEIMSYFIAKCELKGKKDHFLYGKSKNKLNAGYGMHATDPVRDVYETDGHEWTKTKQDIATALDKFYKNKNNCLSYQDALWVTAHVRYLLHRGRKLLTWPVYWDTDSLKYIGKHPKQLFKQLNNEIAKDSIAKGAYYDSSNGKRYILGLFDIESPYRRFKTLGAKKYVYEDMSSKLHVTVAGINKQKGAKALQSIENFRIGNELHDVGRTVAYYQESGIHKITVNGDTFTTASNISLQDTTYTIGVDDDYLKILRKVLGFSLDINPEKL